MPAMQQGQIGIIGGGAAGLCAAVFLSRAAFPVTVFEALPRVGKKLLATGNGRCNLSNLGVSPSHYRGDRAAISAVLDRFSPDDAQRFFRSIGVYPCADEEGRIYPRSEQAASVLDALRYAAAGHGATLSAGAPVTAVRHTKQGFVITRGSEETTVRRLIMATGGRAASSFDGYALLKSFGLTVTPLSPALCPVPVAESILRALKGLRVHASVRLIASGRTVEESAGEVQFTEHALSGICVYELSSLAGTYVLAGQPVSLSLNLLPDVDNPRALLSELAAAIPDRAAEDFLSGLLPKRIGMTLVRAVFDGAMTAPVRELPSRVLDAIAVLLRDWRFTPNAVSPWNAAQVTHGGVSSTELIPETLECRRVNGLYVIGEALDVDGDCGGYNLHWAWASAHAAASAILREV
ncbi:MAG: aminoacetone oxidase family FAD-binding enzyme [Clostridiaceae bacterium]|nr:aminoacetone oxidase family FAD-binding enzyme [Clostridiaceae bacterium]